MPDITMSLDDTLELDTIIEKSTKATNPIEYDSSNFTATGIQTHTGILKPENTGTYTININGQELTVKVKGTNIPNKTVKRTSDDSKTTNNNLRGLKFSPKESFGEIGYKLSSNTGNVTRATLYDFNSNSRVKTVDISGTGFGGEFTVKYSYDPSITYGINIDAEGNSYDSGYYDGNNMPYENSEIKIIENLKNETNENTGFEHNIIGIGQYGGL